MSIDSPTPFFNTYPVLLTPPHPLSDSSPTESSTFSKANRAVNDLIRAMKNKTNKLQTSDPAEHLLMTQSAKIAFPTFLEKPLAMALYQQNRQRVARVPGQLEVKTRRSCKPLNRASGTRFQRKVFQLKVDGSRPSNRILLDGYNSDTRLEWASSFNYDRACLAIITTQSGAYLPTVRYFDRQT